MTLPENRKWKYGNAWERYPVRYGQVWGTENGSKVAAHNIFGPLPAFMCEADLVFVDPPWSQGNLNSFYTKAGRSDYIEDFSLFIDRLFVCIADINPHTCYIEVGKQSVEDVEARLKRLYPHVKRYNVFYYKKHPCHIVRGSHRDGGPELNGIDEAKCIEIIAKEEEYRVIGDLCMGRGLVGMAAHMAQKPFVGTELNERRLACLLDNLAKNGVEVKRIA